MMIESWFCYSSYAGIVVQRMDVFTRRGMRRTNMPKYKHATELYNTFCAVMHFGFANEGMEVRMGDKVLAVGCAEK